MVFPKSELATSRNMSSISIEVDITRPHIVMTKKIIADDFIVILFFVYIINKFNNKL